ncbi:hypothetical protein GCM10009765_66430 [Fodinicola feengrottensis]|uniref:Uncharacterized protein n=1 Tax=Fodinicola feengrottensis TaxID=435914 RepID=A0ABP4UL71_9ACTN
MSQRSEYTAGLRALADLLDKHPEVPLPYSGRSAFGGHLTWILAGDTDQRNVLADIARALPGPVHKVVRGVAFDLKGALHGLHVLVIADRAEVCTRRVVGIREVTKEIPDPAAPTVTVTESVEDVVWDCHPLLSNKNCPTQT